MRNSFFATCILALTCGSASAADLPRPAPYQPYAPIQKMRDWTGFYLGANLGGGWADANSDFSFAGGAPFASAHNGLTGILGGAQLGYNWQTGPAVFGIETDFQFSSMKGSLDSPPCPASICGVAVSASYEQTMPWFGTVRGRLGYAADGWLIYATGGYAYSQLKTNASASAGGLSASDSRTEFRNGWTAGAGIEVALAQQWSAKVEYLYLDFGSASGNWVLTGIPTVEYSTRLYDNVVRAGVNYRF